MSLGHLPTYGWVSKHHEQGQWWLLRVSKTEIWLCFVYFYLSNPEHKRILRKAKCQHLLGIHAFARSWQRLSSRHTCPDKKFEESNHLHSDNSFKGQGMVESSSQLQGQASWEGWKQSLGSPFNNSIYDSLSLCFSPIGKSVLFFHQLDIETLNSPLVISSFHPTCTLW